jgi:hypothetical protein
LRKAGFEEGKRRLATALVERIVNGREILTCRQLLQETAPDYIKENILALAQRRLKQEKPFSWNSTANFDIHDAEVRAGFDKLAAALVRSIRLSRNDVERCVQDALFLRLDVLIRPSSNLEKYVFNPADHLEKRRLLYKLDLVGSDIPFVVRMKDKIVACEEPVISKLVFALISKEIKVFLYSNDSKWALLKDFDLLVNMFQLEESLRPQGVDAGFLEDFLHARGLDEYIPAVQKKIQQGKVNWQHEDFADLFDFNRTPLTPPHVLFKTSHEGDKRLPIVVFPEEKDGPVYRAQREHQPPGPYPSIRTLIDSKDYKVLVYKLFERDERAFRLFIEKVDHVDKWREAKQLIDWELNKRHLDPYCKEAVKLGDLVFAKYFNNSGYL